MSQPWNSRATSQTFCSIDGLMTAAKKPYLSEEAQHFSSGARNRHHVSVKCFSIVYFNFKFTNSLCAKFGLTKHLRYYQSAEFNSNTTMALRVRLQLLARPSRLCYVARRCYSNEHTVSQCIDTGKFLYVFTAPSSFSPQGAPGAIR